MTVTGPGKGSGRGGQLTTSVGGVSAGTRGLTKAELVDQVARSADLTKKRAETVVNTVFSSIVGSLREGEKIELRGFGSFRIRQRGSRIGRNPKTGDRVEVPPKKIPYFKPGKELREMLNEDD